MATHKEKKVVRILFCPRCDFTSEKKRILKVHIEAHMKDESARTAAPNLTKCATTLTYRDYGPPTTTSGTNSSSTISSNRWTATASAPSSSPSGSRSGSGKFDFQKNVAGFLQVNRRRDNVQMKPVFRQYFPDYGVQPEIDGGLGAVEGGFDEDVEAKMEVVVEEPDVKPVFTSIKPR